jgi:hypothetical protein
MSKTYDEQVRPIIKRVALPVETETEGLPIPYPEE